ncbi:hypothetical protein N1851_000319 [Merluccius polli]|uniref:SWIM-type domain-containing protein n=1 Tax=Merluccius polli TaxID=89951 RepID=A0AA47NC89_MERPO|nr:hypothetical protein N1851_000319 [Merluccius polli]
MSLATDNGCLMAFSCSCVAGKGFCNHIVAVLYQTAHYLQLWPVQAIYRDGTDREHRWGIHPELVSDVVVRKPTTGGKSGPFPDLMAAGAKLREVQPQPRIALVLDGLLHGSPLPYHCPPPLETSNDIILHHLAPEFPALPLPLHQNHLSNLDFVPTLHQQLHLHSLQVSPQMASEIEKETRQQSKCPVWVQLCRPRLIASRFREACASREGKADPAAAAKALAGQMIRGSRKQTAAMTQGLQMESEVLTNYAEFMQVNVLSVGFVIPPEAPHLGASPDGRVYDPSESPLFGLIHTQNEKQIRPFYNTYMDVYLESH